jgi:hypothetical protein
MQTLRHRRHLLKLTPLCVLLLSLALAAGCASDSENQPSSEANGAAPPASSADSAKTVSSVAEEEAREVAEKVILTLRDFPAGWSQLPPDKDEDPPLELPEECRTIFDEALEPGAVLDIDSPEFEGPDKEKVDSSVTIYVDAVAAHQSYLEAQLTIDACREPLAAASAKYLQDLLRADRPPETIIEVPLSTWDWLPFPPYGEEGLSMRWSVTLVIGDQSLSFYTDMFGWRVGRVEGDMTFYTESQLPDPEEEQRLAQIIDERLRDAADDLD